MRTLPRTRLTVERLLRLWEALDLLRASAEADGSAWPDLDTQVREWEERHGRRLGSADVE